MDNFNDTSTGGYNPDDMDDPVLPLDLGGGGQWQPAPEPRRRRRWRPAEDAGSSRVPADEPANPSEPVLPVFEEKSEPVPEEASEKKGVDLSFPTGFFKEGRARLVVGVVLLFGALYFLVASVSYLRTGIQDQSLVLDGATTVGEVSNAAGIVGAKSAHFIVARWLGLGSFAVLVYLVILGLSCLRVTRCNLLSLTFKSLLCAIAISVVAGFVSLNRVHFFPWGGSHGYEVNRWLLDNTGYPGAVAVSLLLLSFVFIAFLSSLIRRFKWIVSKYRSFRTSVKLENERREKQERDNAVQQQQQQPVAKSAGPDEDITAVEDEQPIHNTPAPISDAPAPVLIDQDIINELPELEKIDESMPEDESSDEDPLPDLPISGIETPEDEVVAPEDEEPERQKETYEAVPQQEEFPEIPVVDYDAGTPRHIIDEPFDPHAELPDFKQPSMALLAEHQTNAQSADILEQEESKRRITATLDSFGIKIDSITATVGPTVTLFKIVPSEGVRIAKIKNLEDDIARSIAAIGTRIIAPIPGEETVGIEVPNRDPQIVSMRTILASEAYRNTRMELPMAMGATIDNRVYMADLCKMPHLLVAGATGMGKSVGLNVIITSLLFKKHPSELKFVLVDPKRVEFSLYRRIERHYLAKLPDEENPIIIDPNKVVPTLNSLCVEMDNRYELLEKAEVRSITEYNRKFVQRKLNFADGHRYLPYIVVIVDEFADLIMTAGKEVEQPIARIAQKARAVGIHLILATQRPSTNVITGVIKANFPGRIAFRVFQMVDSRTIIDRPGANQLIGRGDMLFSRDGIIERVQCALVETEEVESICASIAAQQGYREAYELPEYVPENSGEGGNFDSSSDNLDPLLPDVAMYVVQSNNGSTSMVQRRWNIGYPRAGKIMDQMEGLGIVGPALGGKPRSVLIDTLALERLLEIHGIN